MHFAERNSETNSHEPGPLNNIGLAIHGLIGRGAKEIKYAIQRTYLKLKLLELNWLLREDTWQLHMMQQMMQQKMYRRLFGGKKGDSEDEEINMYRHDIVYFEEEEKFISKKLTDLQRRHASQSPSTRKLS